MFDPDAGKPRQNRALIYLGACVIAGLRFAREEQVNVRAAAAGKAIDGSIKLAQKSFNKIFRKTFERMT